jgi:hypothetical protein
MKLLEDEATRGPYASYIKILRNTEASNIQRDADGQVRICTTLVAPVVPCGPCGPVAPVVPCGPDTQSSQHSSPFVPHSKSGQGAQSMQCKCGSGYEYLFLPVW